MVALKEYMQIGVFTMSQRLPAEELQGIPGGTLITETPEEGRQLAMLIARHTIHQIQPNPDALKAGARNTR